MYVIKYIPLYIHVKVTVKDLNMNLGRGIEKALAGEERKQEGCKCSSHV